MRITGLWMGIIAIVFGVLVLVFPDLLRWLVAIFLIVVGVLGISRR